MLPMQDRYGVVLMSEPLLGDVVGGLLAVVVAAQQYSKVRLVGVPQVFSITSQPGM